MKTVLIEERTKTPPIFPPLHRFFEHVFWCRPWGDAAQNIYPTNK